MLWVGGGPGSLAALLIAACAGGWLGGTSTDTPSLVDDGDLHRHCLTTEEYLALRSGSPAPPAIDKLQDFTDTLKTDQFLATVWLLLDYCLLLGGVGISWWATYKRSPSHLVQAVHSPGLPQ